MHSRRRGQAHPFVPRVLRDELQHLQRRRHLAGIEGGVPVAGPHKPVSECCVDPQLRVEEATEAYADTHRVRPFAVAFSGGGIRSATFNLGLVQALAERGLLPYVDYLSTVSGGGYVGSWLHGLIKRRGLQGAAQALHPSGSAIPGTPECDSISFLRKYSNYLAPRLGLFQSDTWVIGMIWIRNMLLNQLALVPAILCVFSFLLLAGFVQQAQLPPWVSVWAPFIAALGVITGAGWLLAKNLDEIVDQTFATRTREAAAVRRDASTAVKARLDQSGGRIVPLMLVGAFLLACTDLGRDLPVRILCGLLILGGHVLLQVRGGFVFCYRDLHEGNPRAPFYAAAHVVWMSVVSAAFATALLFAYWNWSASASPWAVLTFGPAIVAMSLGAGVSLQIGLMGSDFPDAAREFSASTGASILILAAGWTALLAIGVYGPWAVSWLLATYGTKATALLWSWAGMTAAGVIAGRSTKSTGTGDGQNSNRLLQLIVNIAPTVFMLGYLTLIATALHAILRALPAFAARSTAVGSNADWFQRHFAGFASQYFAILDVTNDKPAAWLDPNRLQTVLGVLAISALICAVASRRFNINEFSLHHFYKNRLVRAYLGASNNRERSPNAQTGFDATDDFPVADLRVNLDQEDKPVREEYPGPYALVNVALNLNTGSELAKQERKATSFVFTPRYSGFEPAISRKDREEHSRKSELQLHGYRETLGYAYAAGPSIGTAMAISGAAANPNSGYHTSGPVAFLLTVFDARLGWWLGNPRRADASQEAGPRFALKYLLAELFAQTTGRSQFINLSDGGHFDNIGLYELIRRRCRYIIVGDAEQDGDLAFGSLGETVRRCRADFGVEIDLDPTPIKTRVDGFSKVHCIVGTVYYPEQETGECAGVCGGSRPATASDRARGWILYVKSSLTGDEPADVVEYRSRCPQFPHESTGDQFFSESQFESYRRLGLHAGRDAFEEIPLTASGPSDTVLTPLFQQLAQKWYSPTPVSDSAAARLADQYASLMSRLANEQALMSAFGSLIRAEAMAAAPGGASKPSPAPAAPGLDTVGFAFGLELLQLMENVFGEFKLEHAANRANPRNAGWMKTFRRWAQCRPLADEVWAVAKDDYNPMFQRFVESLRQPGQDDPPPRI